MLLSTKKERSQISDLDFHFKKPEKEKKSKLNSKQEEIRKLIMERQKSIKEKTEKNQ